MYQNSPFPVNAFPTIVRNAMYEVAKNVKAPDALIAQSALGVMSLVCQDHINVCRMEGLESPVSLYTVSIADSGDRKSAVDSNFKKPVDIFEIDQAERLAPLIVKWRVRKRSWDKKMKGLELAICKAAQREHETTDLDLRLEELMANEPVEPIPSRRILGNATPEAILQALHMRGHSVGLMTGEGATIFDGRGLSHLGNLNEIWSGQPIAVDRVTRPSFSLRDARLTISIMVQPGTFQNFLATKGVLVRDVGLLARMLVSYSPSLKGERFIVEQNPCWQHLPVFHARATEILSSSAHNLGSTQPAKEMLVFTPDAQAIWISFFNEVEAQLGQGKRFDDISDHASKIAENAARVAAIFHYFGKCEGDIGRDSIERAIKICRWYLIEFKRLFGHEGLLSPEMVAANLMEAWLVNEYQRDGNSYIGLTHILQYGPPSLRTKAKRDTALLTLLRMNRVAIFIIGKSDYVQLTQNAAYFGPPVVNKFTSTVPNGAINGAVSGYPSLPYQHI